MSEKEEEELFNRFRENIPNKLIVKSRLKHYIKRYREEKRPCLSFFETILKIFDSKEVWFKKIVLGPTDCLLKKFRSHQGH
jgi:hypothetical protein